MIKITQLLQYASLIETNTDIAKYILVTNESQMAKKMQDLKTTDFPLLVVVIPSYDASAVDRDSFTMTSQMLMFVLKRDQFQGQKAQTYEDDMEETLALVEQIMYYFINGFTTDCFTPDWIIPNSFHVDPELNFLGCYGWSISFQMKN